MRSAGRWDLFCRVVDNFGDIGIAWRLARQLAPRVAAVRLHVDDLATFACIEPRVDESAAVQSIDGVAIERWPREAGPPADVVVEVLGCGLPAIVLDAMARATPRPVWIDFEHLSAEDWVADFHGRPSPHPTRALVKHFFYPGFGDATGGLLVEPDLDARRRGFLADGGRHALRRALGVAPGRRLASLFAYAEAPVDALLDAFADAGGWSVAVPPGAVADAVRARSRRCAEPAVAAIPFTSQDDYDRLLWSCDANLVRGEDSFVRAQAAGVPFVWNAYRQTDGAHLVKLGAFEDRYAAVRPPPTHFAFERAWNGSGDVASTASAWIAALDAVAEAADAWRARVLSDRPLVERLAAFVARVAAERGIC